MRSRAREESILIEASPESVFDLIHDYKRRLEWDPFLKEATLLGQPYALDNKKSVQKVLDEAGATLKRFSRIKVGI